MRHRIRNLRKQKGWTIKEVARRAGTSEATISRLETQRMTVSTDWLERLAGIFNVAPADLIEGREARLIEFVGAVGADGAVARLRDSFWDAEAPLAEGAVAIQLACPMGPFSAGDYLIGQKIAPPFAVPKKSLLCFAELDDQRIMVGRLYAANPGHNGEVFTFVPLTDETATLVPISECRWLARICRRISYYDDVG